MDSSSSQIPIIPLFTFLFLSLFITSSYSALTCATQKPSSNHTFKNCTALTNLGATLHFTFNATNRTLSVAFSAEPPSSSGYVAWGLNLAGGGMLDTQALIAFPANSTAVTVARYNLTSYKAIDEVKAFTFDSYNITGEHSNGVITIYATVKIPDTATNVSHVWQVGPVEGGKPAKHAFNSENLHSKAALPAALGTTAAGGNATAPAPASKDKSGAGGRFYFGWILVGAFIVNLVVMS